MDRISKRVYGLNKELGPDQLSSGRWQEVHDQCREISSQLGVEAPQLTIYDDDKVQGSCFGKDKQIFISRGAVEGDQDQARFILAHEIAHLLDEDPVPDKFRRRAGMSLLVLLVSLVPFTGALLGILSAGWILAGMIIPWLGLFVSNQLMIPFAHYQRQSEHDADWAACQITGIAGLRLLAQDSQEYDLRRAQRYQGVWGQIRKAFDGDLATHPSGEARLAYCQARIDARELPR